ncbi:hypothetical protein [Soonwooa purpurea]
MEKLWIWLDDLIYDIYFEKMRYSYGIPFEMFLALPLLLAWWIWKFFKK